MNKLDRIRKLVRAEWERTVPDSRKADFLREIEAIVNPIIKRGYRVRLVPDGWAIVLAVNGNVLKISLDSGSEIVTNCLIDAVEEVLPS
jgi:hypothetical protein